ncbi:hypothetical protein MT418_003635 [Batrachochytrium dendrobatidis]
MIQKSTNKAEMIKAFREYGIMQQLITIYSRTDVNLYDYGDETSIVKLVKTLADFADNHPDSSIRTELEQGRIFENLMAIVKSDTAKYTNRKIAGQIIETCFQHRVQTANSSIWPYNENAKIGTSSGIAGYVRGNARTLVEMRYIQYLQCILCKPMWWIDITNQHIVEQWRADSLGQNISPSTFNLALEQLGVFVKQLVCSGSDGLGTIVPGPVELTYILDNGIPDNVYTRLMTNVSDLEHGSNHNTGQMVHNLIDASMYSVVYGQTMIAPLSIRLKYTTMVPCDILLSTRLVSDTPIINGNSEFISCKFQWLPSEFHVEQDGSVTINSYINNLNPIWHRDMYKCIAKIFKCFVPMFESLFRTMDPMFKYIDIRNGTKGYESSNQSDHDNMESDTQVTRPVYVPTLPEHFQSKYESAKPVSLRGRNLQVIVKLTNIQLTPSKPKYDKGNWHNEGPINESIAAIGLYYYDVENITTPKLDFRVAVDCFDYQGASDMYWKDVYGIDLESRRNQYIGSLEVSNGRCVVYPNRYQHKEQSFELADPTQPGHCKILTFFVVNPSRRIVSTAHVAPQQPQWYNSSLDKACIPPELWNDATQYIQGVQSPAEVKRYRDELTSDRTQITAVYNKDIYERVSSKHSDMVQLLHVVIGLIASTSSVRAIEQTSISDVSLAEKTHGLSAGVVDPLLTSGGNCPSDGRNCDNDSCSQYGWCDASDATETTSVSHLATRALLSPTCQPFINPFMNEGTHFLDAISYIMYNPVVAGPTTMGCYCSDDGTNTICVTSRSQFHYTSVQDFVSAIGNPTVSLQLNSYCWKCNRTAPVIEAVASAFSVSVYPSAIAAGIQPPAPANGVSHSPSSYSITATIGAICAIILFMYGV